MRWEIWTMVAMGLISSPFATTRIFAWGVEVIIGDEANHFYWYSVVKNCPGTN